jgi:hypothetical protein
VEEDLAGLLQVLALGVVAQLTVLRVAPGPGKIRFLTRPMQFSKMSIFKLKKVKHNLAKWTVRLTNKPNRKQLLAFRSQLLISGLVSKDVQWFFR